MIYIVTGGAGFIGANVVAELERRDLGPIIIVDDVGSDGKWRNLSKRGAITAVLPTTDLGQLLGGMTNKEVSIIHMGAVSSTKAVDATHLTRNNAMLTASLFELAHEHRWRFVYASSAQVYGTSSDQSDDDKITLRPVTAYGWSKALADQMVLKYVASGSKPPIWAGLRFFNVYGPCEDHKGDDKSFVARCFDSIKRGGSIQVFRGSDGFLRDWVSVSDCARLAVDIASGVLPLSGIYNVGSGEAVSFIDVASTCITVANRPSTQLSTIQFPPERIGQYQSYTKADMRKLRADAPGFSFTKLPLGAADYWQRSAALDGMDRFP